jgi:hypothetical protein
VTPARREGDLSPRMVKIAADLMDALMDVQPLVDSGNPPKSISFVVLFHDMTGKPTKVLTRTESSRDVTGRARPGALLRPAGWPAEDPG